jgi:hypothetical protein
VKCARCDNEVFRILARYGKQGFHCGRCGLEHSLQPQDFGKRRAAKRNLRLLTDRSAHAFL